MAPNRASMMSTASEHELATESVHGPSEIMESHPPKFPVNTVHGFFKQKRTLSYKYFVDQMKKERGALIENAAATIIQSVFRGWLIRSNMKLLHRAATKIQALWRRAIARMLYHKLYQEREEKRHNDMLNAMATRIQAAWRGYWSRKNILDFKKYKELMRKNAEMERAIAGVNEIESALSFGSDTSTNLDDLLNDISDTRLNAWLGDSNSLTRMFPEFPDDPRAIKPDLLKLQLLKEAILRLRDEARRREDDKLKKLHYLMRTAVVPGIYSDVYTNKLTEIEEKLKALRFPIGKHHFESPPRPPRKKALKLGTRNLRSIIAFENKNRRSESCQSVCCFDGKNDKNVASKKWNISSNSCQKIEVPQCSITTSTGSIQKDSS